MLEAFNLSKVRGKGRAPEMTVTKSARINALDNKYLVAYNIVPIRLHSYHVRQLVGRSSQQFRPARVRWMVLGVLCCYQAEQVRRLVCLAAARNKYDHAQTSDRGR